MTTTIPMTDEEIERRARALADVDAQEWLEAVGHLTPEQIGNFSPYRDAEELIAERSHVTYECAKRGLTCMSKGYHDRVDLQRMLGDLALVTELPLKYAVIALLEAAGKELKTDRSTHAMQVLNGMAKVYGADQVHRWIEEMA